MKRHFKRSSAVLAAALVFAAAGASAQSFTPNRLDVGVTSLTGSTFATSAGGRLGARGAWCAAGFHALRALGQPGSTRIFVREAASKPGSRVVFGIGPGNTQPQSVVSLGASVRNPGSNLSADHAFSFCADTVTINNR